MSEQHYFPPLKGPVDCAQCEAADCWCRNMHQRSRRDFTHTSGRCPRLPDLRGFVERDQREAYAAAFMLIHAELSLLPPLRGELFTLAINHTADGEVVLVVRQAAAGRSHLYHVSGDSVRLLCTLG